MRQVVTWPMGKIGNLKATLPHIQNKETKSIIFFQPTLLQLIYANDLQDEKEQRRSSRNQQLWARMRSTWASPRLSRIGGEEGDNRHWVEDEVLEGFWVLQTSALPPPAPSYTVTVIMNASLTTPSTSFPTVTMGRKYLQIRRAMRRTSKMRGAPNSAMEAKPFGPTCLLLQRWEGFLRSASKDEAASDPWAGCAQRLIHDYVCN